MLASHTRTLKLEICCQVGVTLNYIHSVSKELLQEELKKLEILPTDLDGPDLIQALNGLYPHDIGHYLGMDVHDTPLLSHNVVLQPGMVITVEPGVYIRRDFPIQNHIKAKEFLGAAVRIEDDVLITSDGPQVLNKGTPQTVEEISAIIN
uniref:Peptidase M24 domain-containing protein n=1 Tax=Amphimedon queenslandica TaxID=400682 RepID=A0A1X7TKH7_AMPQE